MKVGIDILSFRLSYGFPKPIMKLEDGRRHDLLHSKFLIHGEELAAMILEYTVAWLLET